MQIELYSAAFLFALHSLKVGAFFFFLTLAEFSRVFHYFE